MSSHSAQMKAPPVKAFMSHVLFVLEEDTSLGEAAQFFASHKLTTVPVVAKNGDILGVLSDFHLLRGLLRCKQEGKDGTSKLGDIKDEFDPVVKIHENDSIVNAFRLMIQSPNHRIYTVNNNKLTGALSPKDLLTYMGGGKDKDPSTAEPTKQYQLETILRELSETRRLLSDYQQMFHDAPYLMHSLDLNGKIVAANRMLHYVLGYGDGELVGKSLRLLYPPENVKSALEGLETVKSLGFHPIVNVSMMKKDGSTVRVDIATTLRKDEGGHPEATITVGRLSDSHRMVNFLQRASQLTRKLKRSS